MEQLRGYPVRVEEIAVGGRTYALLVPTDGDTLLDDPRVEARFKQNEYMPYWATLWPAALLLADAVAVWGAAHADVEPPTVLEVGCGLGLVGLVAADLGYRVTVSDYDADALAFAWENARRNALSLLAARYIDWRATGDELHFDRIVAADVLYETRNVRPIAEFVRRHLKPEGLALVSDANRATADSFETIARVCGLTATVTKVQRPDRGRGAPIRGRIYHLRHDSVRSG